MNRKEEKRLYEISRKAKRLRETINKADSMIRCWARNKRKVSSVVLHFRSEGQSYHYWPSYDIPLEAVEKTILPTLREVRLEARKELEELSLPR